MKKKENKEQMLMITANQYANLREKLGFYQGVTLSLLLFVFYYVLSKFYAFLFK